MLWFESKNRAEKRTKNISFSPLKKGKNIDDIVKIKKINNFSYDFYRCKE